MMYWLTKEEQVNFVQAILRNMIKKPEGMQGDDNLKEQRVRRECLAYGRILIRIIIHFKVDFSGYLWVKDAECINKVCITCESTIRGTVGAFFDNTYIWMM